MNGNEFEGKAAESLKNGTLRLLNHMRNQNLAQEIRGEHPFGYRPVATPNHL
jgi:hypothetical protein